MGDIERARKGWMPALGEAPRGDFSADLALREWETAGLAAKKIPAPDRDLRDRQSHEVGVFQRSARAPHPDAITGFDLSKMGNWRCSTKNRPGGYEAPRRVKVLLRPSARTHITSAREPMLPPDLVAGNMDPCAQAICRIRAPVTVIWFRLAVER